MKFRTAAILTSTALTLTACSSTVTEATKATTPASSTTTKANHVGDTLQVGPEAVTLHTVTAPATPVDQYSSAPSGNTLASAQFTIKNTGTKPIASDANNNATAIGSNGQTLQIDFSQVAGCTSFSEGNYTITPGSSATGCVNFDLPTGVTVSRVQWSRNTFDDQSVGVWQVP